MSDCKIINQIVVRWRITISMPDSRLDLLSYLFDCNPNHEVKFRLKESKKKSVKNFSKRAKHLPNMRIKRLRKHVKKLKFHTFHCGWKRLQKTCGLKLSEIFIGLKATIESTIKSNEIKTDDEIRRRRKIGKNG